MVTESCSRRPYSPAELRVIHNQILWTLRHEGSEKALKEVDVALAQVPGKDLEWIWRLKVLKAQILLYKSDHQDALFLLREPLPASLSGTDIVVRKALMEGIAHRQAQQFAQSELRLGESERLARASHPRLLGDVLNARGALEVDEKKLLIGEATFKEALTLMKLEGDQDGEVSVLNNLARVAMSQQHFDEAVDRGIFALEHSRARGLRPLTATILGNLGWSYSQLGDFYNGLEYFKEGAEESQRSGLPGYSAYWFTGVANAYLALDEYGLAEDLARSTFDRAQALKNAQTTTECLNTLSEVMLRTHRLGEAKRYNQEALNIEDSGGDTFGVPDSLILAAHIAVAEKRFADGERFFRRVLAGPSPDAPLRWQAEAGLGVIREEQGKAKEAEQLYLQAINTIEKARRSINHDELRLSFLSSGMAVYGRLIDFLVRHGRQTDALHQAELSRARTLGEGLSWNLKVGSHGILDAQPQLLAQGLHATLLFYWIGHNHSYLWVITSAKTVHFELPKAAEIEPLVKSYQKTLLGMRDAQDIGSSAGKQLYAMLVEPAQQLIPRGSRVVILPAESLYGLNFETLIVPNPEPHFWIEDVTLTTASSLTLLEHSARRPATKEKNLLLVGNTEQPTGDFPGLSQASVEMKKIEQYFPDARRKVLEGKQATASGYLGSDPEQFSYLHFVTHGTASRTRPLESAVILSKEGDTYKLYARDIVQHRLSAKLVTISACNGSGTRTYSGEGLVGLAWAFLRAGAHNVIAALWEVSDVSTPQLMDALYKELSEGKDPAVALRDAKLRLLHSSDPNSVFKKPFYWAPFQLYVGS